MDTFTTEMSNDVWQIKTSEGQIKTSEGQKKLLPLPLTTTVTHIHLPFFEVRTDILLAKLV